MSSENKIIRRISQEGRVNIRHALARCNLTSGTRIRLYVQNDSDIVLDRHGCHFCGRNEYFHYKGKRVCEECIKKIAALFGEVLNETSGTA